MPRARWIGRSPEIPAVPPAAQAFQIQGAAVVFDVLFVVITLALFGVFALTAKGVERL